VPGIEEDALDTLDVLLKSRDEGDKEHRIEASEEEAIVFEDIFSGGAYLDSRGNARKKALEQVIVRSRKLGCSILISDSKEGGFKIRYGSIRYAILDVNTKGRVYFHVKAHPNKDLPEELHKRANDFIKFLEPDVTIKNGEINCYGQAEQRIEDIPKIKLEGFIKYAVNTIQDHYYNRDPETDNWYDDLVKDIKDSATLHPA